MIGSMLSELGLTQNEIKIYLALLDIGESLAGTIAENSGIHRRNVYDSLERLIKKGFVSKNHNATLCFLMYYYSEFGIEDIKLFEDLTFKEEEVKFYSNLKNSRQKASYTTKLSFTKDEIENLRERTILFVNKIELLLKND